jgi:hypothetical protein
MTRHDWSSRPSERWYSSNAWKRRAADQIRREPLCAACQARGLVVAARIADHVEEHGGNYGAFRLGRLQSLCAPCHDQKHGRRVTGGPAISREIDEDGYPIDVRHAFNAARPKR